MEIDALYTSYQDGLEDFWARRQNKPSFSRQVQAFDRTVMLRSNDEPVLAAIDHCLPQYSTAPQVDLPGFAIQLVVHAAPHDPGAAPDDLIDYIQYTGDAQWLMMQLGTWGHCYVDLERGESVAVLTPQLARRPDIVGRCLLNTIITNFFIASGYAMLHASCLYHRGRAVLLMATHNSGKSTTALRLALAGFPLLSDSMIFLAPDTEQPQLFGFPVGRIKLRPDMVSAFPQVQALLVPEMVRGETKHSFDLRRLDPALVYEEAATPAAIDLCLLVRGNSEDTHITPASRQAVETSIMENSLFYDTKQVWRRNLTSIERLVDAARWYHLVIGTDAERIVGALGEFWRAS